MLQMRWVITTHLHVNYVLMCSGLIARQVLNGMSLCNMIQILLEL